MFFGILSWILSLIGFGDVWRFWNKNLAAKHRRALHPGEVSWLQHPHHATCPGHRWNGSPDNPSCFEWLHFWTYWPSKRVKQNLGISTRYKTIRHIFLDHCLILFFHVFPFLIPFALQEMIPPAPPETEAASHARSETAPLRSGAPPARSESAAEAGNLEICGFLKSSVFKLSNIVSKIHWNSLFMCSRSPNIALKDKEILGKL